MIVALSGVEWWSVKKKKLFERSEFFFFSGNTPCSSEERAALTFCFFWVKPKEKRKELKRKISINESRPATTFTWIAGRQFIYKVLGTFFAVGHQTLLLQ